MKKIYFVVSSKVEIAWKKRDFRAYFNPTTYGMLRFRQLRAGGLFGLDPESKVTVNGLIWNLVLIMVRMILVNMQNFKLLAFLLLEI